MQPDDPRHGTPRGRYAHERAGQEMCAACRDAINQYERRRRKSRTLYGRPWEIDATGTRRRLQALHVLGWRGKDIAQVMGSAQSRVSALTVGSQTHVHRNTAEAAIRAYEELGMSLGPSQITRKRAEAHGWAPPLAWDDGAIDDPDARPRGHRAAGEDRTRTKDDVDPIVVERVLAGDKLPTTKAEKFEITRRWTADGRSLNELERLTGWKSDRYVVREQEAS